jgi:putative peptidoglycan lipid II flippase
MSDEMDMELSGVEEVQQTADPAAASSRGLYNAAGLMVFASFVSAITGLIRAGSLTSHYGGGSSADLNAYFQAFTIPDFVYFLVAGGAMRTGFVPIFSQFMARDQADRAWRMFRNTLWILTLGSALVVGVAMIFPDHLAWVIAPGWHPDPLHPEYQHLLTLTAQLMRIMFPSVFFMAIGGLLMGALNARKHFLWPGLGPVFYNVFIIIATWLSPWLGGLRAVAFSVPLSAFVCNVVMQLPPLVKLGARFRFRFDLRDEDFHRVFKLAAPVLFGLSVTEISTVVTKAMATKSDPAYGPLGFELANRLWKLPTRFIGAGIAIAVFAYLADHFVRDDAEGYRRDFSFGVRSIIFLTLPPAIAMTLLRTPIVLLLYPGTSAPAVQVASDALLWYGLGIIPLSLTYIFIRAFYARHDMWTAVWVGVTSEIITISVALWLGRPDLLRVSGLAIAMTASNTYQAALLAYVLARRIGAASLDLRRIGESFLRQAFPCAGFGAVCWYALNFCERHFFGARLSKPVLALEVFAPALAATAVFILLAWLFRVEELTSAGGMLLRKFRRR